MIEKIPPISPQSPQELSPEKRAKRDSPPRDSVELSSRALSRSLAERVAQSKAVQKSLSDTTLRENKITRSRENLARGAASQPSKQTLEQIRLSLLA